MATPQQPELQRSNLSPADPSSAKAHTSGARPGGGGRRGKVPADNQPGHHPDHEQDKPIEAFVARAQQKARETQEHEAAARHEAEARPQEQPKAPTAAVGPATLRPSKGPKVPRVRIAGIPAEALAPPLAILDAALRPESVWEEVGESRRAWIARLTLVPGLAGWRYATVVRPRLDAAEAAATLRGA